MQLAGLAADLEAEGRADTRLAQNWETVQVWTEGSRYLRTNKVKAERLYYAIADKKGGVLPWIKARW